MTSGPAKEGHYIRIDIPGPDSIAGNGFDRVRIHQIVCGQEDGNQFTAGPVCPAKNPETLQITTAHS